MNRENLLKMAAHIETVPQNKFDMRDYRKGGKKRVHCGSVGCVVGHCVELDYSKPPPLLRNGEIRFNHWSERFTGLGSDSAEWDWCFAAGWEGSDNTPTGAARRIRYLVEHGLPKKWWEQVVGETPIEY